MAGLSQVPGQQAVVDQRNAHEGRDPNRFRGRGEVEAARPRKYFHKEFGWAMTKDEAEAWAGFKTKVAENASKYKKEYVDPAYKARDTAIRQGRASIDSQFAKVSGKLPAWKEPSYTRIRLAGDGDPGQDYMVVSDNVGAFLGAFKNDYYKIKPQKDGSYHIHMKEYGKEGYEAANDYMRRQDQMLNLARKNYKDEIGAAKDAINKQKKNAYGQLDAQIEAQAGEGLRSLDQNHRRLAGQFEEERQKELGRRESIKKNLNESVLGVDIAKATAGRRGLSEEI